MQLIIRASVMWVVFERMEGPGLLEAGWISVARRGCTELLKVSKILRVVLRPL